MAAAKKPFDASSAAPALRIRRLRLSAFRNYQAVALNPDARPVVLTGPNGAGKTNLLEALSMLTPGRGLRRAKTGEMDRIDPDSPPVSGTAWAVAGTVETPFGPV